MKQFDKLKKHTKDNKEFYLAGAWAAGVGALAVWIGTREKAPKNQEPTRLADSQHIVLENVNGENLWFDMDEPDNYYRLEGVWTPLA